MAQNNWIFTESLYQDTDGADWGDGKVDTMYVGRIAGDSASDFKGYMDAIVGKLKNSHVISDGNNVSLTSGEGNGCFEDDSFRKTILEAEPYFSQSNYSIVCQSDGTCGNDCRDGNWTNGCLLGSEHLMPAAGCQIGTIWSFNDLSHSFINAYNDHGYPRGTSNFSGTDFSSPFPNFPTFHFFTCLCGLVDENDSDLMVYSLFNARFSSMIAATTETSTGHDEFFIKKFYERLTGQMPVGPLWITTGQLSVGESLNAAKNVADGGGAYDLSNFAFTLYGVPWITYMPQNNNSARSSRSYRMGYAKEHRIIEFSRITEIIEGLKNSC